MGWGLERGSCGWHAQSMLHLCTNPPSVLSSLSPSPLSWRRSLKPIGCQLGLLCIPRSRRTCTCLRACAFSSYSFPAFRIQAPPLTSGCFSVTLSVRPPHASLSKMAAIPTPFLSALTTIEYIFDLLITLFVSLFPLKSKFPEGRDFLPLIQ